MDEFDQLRPGLGVRELSPLRTDSSRQRASRNHEFAPSSNLVRPQVPRPISRYVLIPQGARLVREYNSQLGYGQDGIQVIWNRVIYPDGSSLDLSGMLGQDAHGFSGFRDRVDHHYKRLVGFAVLTSLFAAASNVAQNQNRSVLTYPSPGEVAGSAVGQQVSDLGAQITRKNLNVQPTVKIPVGYRFDVRVNRDIIFEFAYSSTN